MRPGPSLGVAHVVLVIISVSAPEPEEAAGSLAEDQRENGPGMKIPNGATRSSESEADARMTRRSRVVRVDEGAGPRMHEC